MASIIQTPITSARFFVVIPLNFNNEVSGYETHYNEMIAWCSKNMFNKWYSGKMQQTARPGGWTEDVGNMAIFNFEDPNDKAHFILKWL